MKPALIRVFVLLLVLVGAAAALGWQNYRTFLQTPLVVPAQGAVFELAPGTGGNEIIR